MKSFDTKIRVRYSETDQMGVVYHGNYFPYFEVSRVEWLRNQGISYKSLEERGIALPIAHVSIDYKAPAYYDDVLTVRTTLHHYQGVKISFDCEIFNEKEQLLTKARFLLVFLDLKSGKPTPPPVDLLEMLTKFAG